MEKTFKPNEKQKAFMGVLKGAEAPMTLREVSKVLGYEVKSGSITCLVSKKMVATVDKSFKCDIVAQETGEVVGTCTKTVKAYSLVE